jgi:hypothetical protein
MMGDCKRRNAYSEPLSPSPFPRARRKGSNTGALKSLSVYGEEFREGFRQGGAAWTPA